MRQPTLYIPHGAGPCFFMEWSPADTWVSTEQFLRHWRSGLAEQPKAILVVSAHWEKEAFTVTESPAPSLYYDYYGFPDHTYQLPYAVPGSPPLAARVRALLSDAGLPHAGDGNRGLDHGVFIPLMLMFPEATIPVVQLSLQAGLSAEAHLALGAAIAPLRDEGVLILGSGMSYHNMRGFSPAYTKRSEIFDAALTRVVTGPEREKALQNWEALPEARNCHPREEHLIPLLACAGAAQGEPAARVFTAQAMNVAISAYQFG